MEGLFWIVFWIQRPNWLQFNFGKGEKKARGHSWSLIEAYSRASAVCFDLAFKMIAERIRELWSKVEKMFRHWRVKSKEFDVKVQLNHSSKARGLLHRVLLFFAVQRLVSAVAFWQ